MIVDTARERLETFSRSPFLPGTVIVFVAALAAGLFAGAYTYAMADPTPRDIPVAVTGVPTSGATHADFVEGMDRATGASLRLQQYDSYAQARDAVDQQQVFAILQLRPGAAELDVSSASGATVAELLAQVTPKISETVGVRLTVRDINPLQPGDPHGLAIFYITLATVVVGFVGATQLTVHAARLRPGQTLAFTAGYAVLGGLAIITVVDWVLGTLRLPLPESWLILSLTMFTCGVVFHMFTSLIGRWAIAPTWVLLVMLGNASSGGAVAWPLLPSLFAAVGQWLPPGAAVNAQHTAIYFGGNQHAFPFLVLIVWAAVCCAVFVFRRQRAQARTG